MINPINCFISTKSISFQSSLSLPLPSAVVLLPTIWNKIWYINTIKKEKKIWSHHFSKQNFQGSYHKILCKRLTVWKYHMSFSFLEIYCLLIDSWVHSREQLMKSDEIISLMMKQQNISRGEKNKITKVPKCILDLWNGPIGQYGNAKIIWIFFLF